MYLATPGLTGVVGRFRINRVNGRVTTLFTYGAARAHPPLLNYPRPTNFGYICWYEYTVKASRKRCGFMTASGALLQTTRRLMKWMIRIPTCNYFKCVLNILLEVGLFLRRLSGNVTLQCQLFQEYLSIIDITLCQTLCKSNARLEFIVDWMMNDE